MDKAWKQLLAVLVLGFVMPLVVLEIGITGNSAPQDLPEQTVPPTQAPTEPTAQELFIPVLTREGTVQLMALEEYILGVVLAEMPASFEAEALRAQAVVARTYTLRRHTLADRHTGAAICTDSGCCQAYMTEEEYLTRLGTRKDVEKIRQAVADTEGLVLTYEDQLAETTYFSCSGGMTEDAQAVWGEWIPYLQAVQSPGEEAAGNYTGSVYFTAEEFCAALGRQLEGSPESWLGKVTRTQGDGVAYMFIGGISYSGTSLRQLLGLNSTAFTMTADPLGIAVTTRGKGHRVGMSQYGADAMALGGSDYARILAHYYPGTRIDKIDALG